jgi:adenine-specific DNA methylase
VAESELPDVLVVEGSSEHMLLDSGVVDLVLTDPPYHDDVQYSELSLPLRAWAGLSLTDADRGAHANAATGTNTSYHDYRLILTSIFSECRRVLRPDGHLIFSYANREPEAWRALLLALKDAGFAAAGWTILHSENEGDVAKRGVRACNLDFLMDLVPTAAGGTEVDGPEHREETDEARYLEIVGRFFSRIDRLSEDDGRRLVGDLARSAFLLG